MSEPRIWILPPEVAERIAAGEVIERPASVVKELVENALDAGARRVSVETEAGGKALIRVTDDGCGMTPDEVRLAILRHATSKLRSSDDLFNIRTLGFRGEALPSIAAISELEILTRTADSTGGTRILVVGGEVRAEEPAPAQIGTTISVRRLFHNVPVREKFLRADSTEAAQITDWMQRLALSRPEVSFRLVHDGREALLSPGTQDPLNAVVAVLGRAIARDVLRLPELVHNTAAGPVRVTGFAGRPTLTRANRSFQHTYVNGRAVRSPIFYRALDDAYRATMPHGRYAVALLFITVPPEAVDVNVHPAKTEVRFQDEGAIHTAIARAVRSALRAEGPAAEEQALEPYSSPFAASPRVAEPGSPPPSPSLPFAESAIGGPPRTAYYPPARERESSPASQGQPPSSRFGGHPAIRPPQPGEIPDTEDPFASEQEGAPDTAAYRAPTGFPGLSVELAAPENAPAIGELTLLGQARDLFILAEAHGSLWIIDQHVAHERILFDAMTAPGREAESPEPLLIPAVVEADRAQALALEEHRALLAELGFLVEPFGPGRFSLRAVPRRLMGRNYEAAFRDLIDELTLLSRGGQLRLGREQVAAAAAGRSCKQAVKAGQKLTPQEMKRLLEQLRGTRNPYTCPHGRPVFLTFEEAELEALFGAKSC